MTSDLTSILTFGLLFILDDNDNVVEESGVCGAQCVEISTLTSLLVVYAQTYVLGLEQGSSWA